MYYIKIRINLGKADGMELAIFLLRENNLLMGGSTSWQKQ
jgi:hypothetical protein